MSIEALKSMKENLMCSVQSQMGNLHQVDAKELGEAVDMVKDLAEAIYYCTITEAMEKKDNEQSQQTVYYTERYIDPYYRDMDRDHGKMYYTERSNSNSSMNRSGGNMSNYDDMGERWYRERPYDMPMRDMREGRSPMRRKMYMESKEMHKDSKESMMELEKYLQELSTDITELVSEATPEEKQILQQKIAAIATKIK